MLYSFSTCVDPKLFGTRSYPFISTDLQYILMTQLCVYRLHYTNMEQCPFKQEFRCEIAISCSFFGISFPFLSLMSILRLVADCIVIFVHYFLQLVPVSCHSEQWQEVSAPVNATLLYHIKTAWPQAINAVLS